MFLKKSFKKFFPLSRKQRFSEFSEFFLIDNPYTREEYCRIPYVPASQIPSFILRSETAGNYLKSVNI